MIGRFVFVLPLQAVRGVALYSDGLMKSRTTYQIDPRSEKKKIR
jgi:hypothetical protein